MNSHEKQYKEYVRLGKELVQNINSYQAQIAFYATKVCEISHGGRKGLNTYTISKYSEDIGLNRKTVSEWVSIYRNVIKKLELEPGDVTKKDWTAAYRVQSILNEEVRVSQAINGISGRKERGSRKEASPERVKDLFDQNYDGPSFQKQIDNWNNDLTFWRNKIIARDLSSLSIGSLITMKESMDEISDIILRHITGVAKKAAS